MFVKKTRWAKIVDSLLNLFCEIRSSFTPTCPSECAFDRSLKARIVESLICVCSLECLVLLSVVPRCLTLLVACLGVGTGIEKRHNQGRGFSERRPVQRRLAEGVSGIRSCAEGQERLDRCDRLIRPRRRCSGVGRRSLLRASRLAPAFNSAVITLECLLFDAAR